jgi:hypothetical protein
VLATIGIAALLTRFRTKQRASLAVAVAACIAMVLPTAAQASMFPYQYSYVNAASEQFGILGVAGDPDYFGTSFREYAHDEGTERIKVVCPFLRYGGPVYRTDTDCRTQFAATYSAYWRGRATYDKPKRDEFFLLVRGSRSIPPNCTLTRQVERRQNLSTVVMSRLLTCHNPTPAQEFESRMLENENRIRVGHAPNPIPPDLWVRWGAIDKRAAARAEAKAAAMLAASSERQ